MTGVSIPQTVATAVPAVDDDTVIDVRGLRMRYGTNDVLDGVGFTVGKARWSRCWGPTARARPPRSRSSKASACGRPARSTVLGIDPARGDEAWRARLGVVLQSWRDHGKWRVRELLAHLGSYYAAYSTDAIRRPWDTDDLIEAVGLDRPADKKAGQLSGGQRRRLDVAIGIVGRPELLFLDEPTAGFDPEARREFHDLVHRLADAADDRSCSPPTTSTRPRSWPTASSSSPAAGSSPTGAPTRCPG